MQDKESGNDVSDLHEFEVPLPPCQRNDSRQCWQSVSCVSLRNLEKSPRLLTPYLELLYETKVFLACLLLCNIHQHSECPISFK